MNGNVEAEYLAMIRNSIEVFSSYVLLLAKISSEEIEFGQGQCTHSLTQLHTCYH